MLIVKIKSEPYPREYKYPAHIWQRGDMIRFGLSIVNDIFYCDEIEYIKGETDHVNEKW